MQILTLSVVLYDFGPNAVVESLYQGGQTILLAVRATRGIGVGLLSGLCKLG